MSRAVDKPRFEIGLVMAGAVSAGAYTAGVLDFMLQALEAWEDAKESQHDDTPSHEVNIKAISGASAGSISAALLSTMVNREVKPVDYLSQRLPKPGDNKFYDTWVEGVDIQNLLDDKDLQDGSIKSLLDSSRLDTIADNVFQNLGAFKYRPYFDRALHIFMCVTNLRGVPYSISLQAEQTQAVQARHELSMHSDYMHFLVGEEHRSDDAIILDPLKLDTPNWNLLKQSALASSAFPGALAPRLLKRRTSDYDRRKWWMPTALDKKASMAGISARRIWEAQQIPPFWPQQISQQGEYEFLCVDGGLMNNEPLELVRSLLAGEGQSNPRGGDEAHRATLMIDPFPDAGLFKPDYQPKNDIISVFLAMFTSLQYQSRFKPEELRLAHQNDVYSRFLIAPTRSESAEDGNPALASSALEGFAGFFSSTFRRHDYQLGRRNCQRFLSRYFVLPESNPLFRDWTTDMKEKYRVEHNGITHLPIIPLMETVNDEIEPLDWPTIAQTELQKFRKQMQLRLNKVVHCMLADKLNILLRLLIWWGWKLFGARFLLNKVIDLIKQDFGASGLLRKE